MNNVPLKPDDRWPFPFEIVAIFEGSRSINFKVDEEESLEIEE